jgi:mannosyl-3-phosphoglycerate phosphatase
MLSWWAPAQAERSRVAFCDLDQAGAGHPGGDEAAGTRAALVRLAEGRVPIVFCSDKTRAELEVLQHELGIRHPFICEGGAAVFVPAGYFDGRVPRARPVAGYDVVEFGRSYTEVVAALHRSAARLAIAVRGFSDMSVEDVAVEGGMPLLRARLAKLREYSEPFKVLDTEEDATPRLLRALRSCGVQCTSRGPYHYAGAVRREVAVQFLYGLYRNALGDLVTVPFKDTIAAC